jgi:uncharacterized protein (TIGR02001 family)
MRKLLMLTLLSTLAAAAFAAEAQPVAAVEENPMVFTLDASYVTKYIWRGFDVLDDKAAFQPSVNLALENGMFFNVWASYAGASKNDGSVSTVDATEYDYTVGYANSFGEDCFVTNYSIGWRFYDYIDKASNDGDMQEGFVELSWPNLIGNGLTPKYAYYHMWASEGSGDVRANGGPIHVAGMDYNWTFESAPELPMTFSSAAVYNDGTGGQSVDSDWSHILWGLSTNFRCPLTNAKVTPSIWYQTSMDDSVNKNDEFFSGLSYALTF